MRLIFVITLLISALPAAAQIYQYTDAKGHRVYTDRPPLDVKASSIELPNINTVSDNTKYLAKADYELPLGKSSKLEAGIRYDNNQNNYDYYVDERRNYGDLTVLPNFTSVTSYGEKILAGYAQFKSKIDNFGYQLGLRAENTDINVDFTSTREQRK